MIIDSRAHNIIEEYAPLGQRVTSSGARLIGHVPHRGPQAYLHIVFPSAKRDSVAAFRSKTKAPKAFDVYADFLSEHNGAIFFLGSLALNGIREGPLSRTVEDRQPFDLDDLNGFERPKNADPETLFVGSYNYDGSLIYIEPSGEVLVCRKGNAIPYAKWPNLGEMISQELLRIAQFYDHEGRVIDKSAKRTPPPNI